MFGIDIPLPKSHYVRPVLFNENDNSDEFKTISMRMTIPVTAYTNKTIGSSWFTKNSLVKGPKLNT